MKLEIHILSHDGERMLGWALAHYRAMGTYQEVSIVVHDGGPKHTQQHLCYDLDARWSPWDTAGQLNDEMAMKLKNYCWRETDADFVAVVDADELLFFPKGMKETLEVYSRLGAASIKPHGFEMFSEQWFDFEFEDKVSGHRLMSKDQITTWAPNGSPDDTWYAKPVLFSPKVLCASGFGVGAHESRPVLKDGRALYISRKSPKANPPTYLLHYHQIGPIEMVAARYDETRKRLADINERNGWGNFVPGLQHAQEKRDLILPGLRRVIS